MTPVSVYAGIQAYIFDTPFTLIQKKKKAVKKMDQSIKKKVTAFPQMFHYGTESLITCVL